MATVHYDYVIGGLRVTVRSRLEEIRPALETLFPRWPGEDAGSSPTQITVASDGSGFLLEGAGESYHTSSPETLIPAIEARVRRLYLAQAGEALPLHSSGFLNDEGEAVLILGPSGAGKTTLLLRALAAGSRGLSDEIHLWDPATGLVTDYPRAYAVKEGTFRAFPELRRLAASLPPFQWNNHRLWYVDPGRSSRIHPSGPVKLAALVLLSRETRDDSLRLVPQWQRLSVLLPHAWGDKTTLSGEKITEIVRALLEIPVWQGTAEAILEAWLGATESEALHADDGDASVCSAAAPHR